ncbi:MAG: polysaccharide deacetylase family protein [Alphaproteobacteria bacterium]|nr:polysaccharide deacetylase family protein [Alphaproteobacteria bacterium]
MAEPHAAPFASGAASARPLARAPLELAVVVDTEEEFDWSAPFARENRETLTIPAQARAHGVFDRFGIVPTYVIDHPVASDPGAAAFLRNLAEGGRAEIGAHLHPWVTPPFKEAVTSRNSYHGNLPPDLERAKIATLTETVATAFGKRPTVFKAGRYGFGPHTAAALVEQGYEIDCSFVPHTSFAADGGPSFYGRSSRPFWLDDQCRLLEIPLTSGFTGPLAAAAERRAGLFDSDAARRLHIPGILARLGLAERIRLSPEGHSVAEQCRLLATLAARGQRLFTLAYHSPSLAPGHSPYVRTEADLAAFLDNLAAVFGFFRDVLGGTFTTLTRYRAGLAAEELAAAE